ncbi:MAG: hypothetical protein LBE89_00100 [Helicobacteraceae bacterium]|jgi:hypothetical protein|nr:hypothetical protein [Helicobacteraceae bacterium]
MAVSFTFKALALSMALVPPIMAQSESAVLAPSDRSDIPVANGASEATADQAKASDANRTQTYGEAEVLNEIVVTDQTGGGGALPPQHAL